tara:strand:+ start:9942 stop:11294 length:1353 start_codon:yes stop_codon:yes gene_type:complete
MGVGANVTPSNLKATLKTDPSKYVSLGDLIDVTKPDNRDLLVNTYGDQGITGFLQLTGATRSGGTSDEVQYWEEGRLHKTATVEATAASGATYTIAFASGEAARPNDVLLLADGTRIIVKSATTAVKMDGGTAATFAEQEVAIIGNVYAQGTGQPSEFYQTEVVKRVNPYFITKESFRVTGSQATNIGWINLGGGEYRWYVKGEMDVRKRFMNQREMMMLLGQKAVAANANAGEADIQLGATAADGIAGSEGYFAAIQDRGITTSGSFGDGAGFADIDELIFTLDKQGAPQEYAMYVDTATSLNIDDMLAAGIATQTTAGLPGQFGAFQNSSDMAVKLGFKSFTRGSYTFHKHGWKLLSDPTLLGLFDTKPFKGAMVPLRTVADAKSGNHSPALEMNYKEVNGYSRELDHWMEGGGVLGYATNDVDEAKFHYRSECNLITRAANQHVLLT